MDILKLTPGDFLKNAGIVGFLRMWQYVKRNRDEPFVITDEFNVDELLQIDLAQAYIDVFIEYCGKDTKTFQAFQRLDRLIERLEGDPCELENKQLQDEIKFIQDSLFAASLKSGFESIQNEISDPDVYAGMLKNKLKAPGSKEDLNVVKQDLLPRLKSLQRFCAQPLVRKVFLFKTVSYNVINNFWTNKCFLLRTNAKKNLIELITSDFVDPLRKFLAKTEYKTNSFCISCRMPLANDKEKTSIAFLIDMADDLSRKTSAFWNCKPDAFLCPVCAFLYAFAPLGFCQVDNGDFVFINANDTVHTLWNNNQPKMTEEGKALSYHEKIDHAILQLLQKKTKIQNNIQVITRSKLDNRYHFNVIDRELIQLIQNKSVHSHLMRLAKLPHIKLSNNDWLNVYRLSIENMLNYRNQYNLLSMLILESLKQPWVNVFLRPVFEIQCAQLIEKEKGSMDLSQMQHFASKAGAELRPILVADKVGRENAATIADEKTEDIIRGIVYQLTNALKVQNVEQFADLIIRLYSSCKLPIPSVFMQALRSGDQFAVIGYAFILGLKGAFYNKKNNDKSGENNNV